MSLKIIKCLTAFMAAWLIVGCDTTSDNGDDGNSTQANIRFTIAMNGSTTRAGTWGDYDYDSEEATTWENAIGPKKLQVLVFDANDKYVCEVGSLTFVSLGQAPYAVSEVMGILPLDDIETDNGKFTGRLVVIANFDSSLSLSKGDPLSKIASSIYLYQEDAFANQTTNIPMWGTQTYKADNSADYQPLTIEKGETAEANTIYMLRSVSKLRVSVTDDVANDFTVESVSISNYNIYGYIIPAGYTANSTLDLYYEGDDAPLSFNPYTRKSERSLSFKASNSGKTFTAYVPEFKSSTNKSDGTSDPYISITLRPNDASGTASTYKISLPSSNAQTTTPENLIRNTIYDFTITSVGPELNLKYQAIDWTSGGGDIHFD